MLEWGEREHDGNDGKKKKKKQRGEKKRGTGHRQWVMKKGPDFMQFQRSA